MVGSRRWAGWGASLAVACIATACTPDIAQDRDTPETMPFDPAADPPLLPQPTDLLINPTTGRIDFAVVGLHVPDDCASQPNDALAQCEFYQYLEGLDGFPTDLSATAPVTAPVDLRTASVPDDLVVVDATRGKLVESIAASSDTATQSLAITPQGGWDVGTTYLFGIRGYAAGLRSEQGRMYVASVPYFLLKRDESLTCGAASAAQLDPSCPYVKLLEAPDKDAASIFSDLSDLEGIRQLYAYGDKLWSSLDAIGGLPKDEAATAWAFPTHSASVVELNPTLGMLPQVVDSATIRLGFKGTMDATTLSAFRLGAPGSVFLLDLTALAANDLVGGLPKFAVSVANHAISLAAEQPLADGHLIAILMTNAVTNAAGMPFVPAPLTVLLRARGPLVDAFGASLVDGVSDSDAVAAEAGRKDLAELLDNPTFASLTGLERESLVYVYAFTFPQP